MVKVEELQSKIKVLKTKVQEATKDKAKTDAAQLRALRKSLKRTQRKARAMLRKKTPVAAKTKGKEEKPATPAEAPPERVPVGKATDKKA